MLARMLSLSVQLAQQAPGRVEGTAATLLPLASQALAEEAGQEIPLTMELTEEAAAAGGMLVLEDQALLAEITVAMAIKMTMLLVVAVVVVRVQSAQMAQLGLGELVAWA